MPANAKHPAAAAPSPVVLFGIDSHGKPKAARFGHRHATLAIKAASQLQLRVLASDDPRVAEIAARLPVGRVHATGRTFVPFIRRDLYDKLVAIAPNGNSRPSASPAIAVSAAAAETKPPKAAPNRPGHWDKISVGDLVVAQETSEDGWYEAIVVEASGEMITVRWRDYPRVRSFVRHRNRLGLLYPGAATPAEAKTPAKPAAPAKQGSPGAAKQEAEPQALPKTWQAIDIGHLVLAKDDGPWESWWEAVPVEKASDSFRLRWRDYPKMPLIERKRFGLALICPEAPRSR